MLGAEVVEWLTTLHLTHKVWGSILASLHSKDVKNLIS
jgi:hypothetical protein